MTDEVPDRPPGWQSLGPVSGFRAFSTPRSEPRVRRASDAVHLVVSGVALAITGALAVPASGIEDAFIGLVDDLPSFLQGLWQLAWIATALWAVAIAGLVAVRRRWPLLRDQVLAVVLAVAVAALTSRLVQGSWPSLGDALGSSGEPAWIPSLRLAAVAAALDTASPHLSRPLRRVSVGMLLVGGLAGVAIGATTPLGAVGGFLAASVAAAAVHLALGSSAGRPGLGEIQTALAGLGVAAESLAPADRQAAGAYKVHAVDGEGRRLIVKVYGRDARDTQVISKAWRALWYRESRAEFTLVRFQQVEHEAFLTLLAATQGVSVLEVVTAGRTPAGDALLVLRGAAVELAELGPDELDDDTLRAVWDEVGRLHVIGITHGQLDLDQIAVDVEGRVVLKDLSHATVAPTDDQVHIDLAQLLVTTAALVGPDRAVAMALDRLGREALAAAVPFVQGPTLGPGLRRRLRPAGLDVDDLRAQAATAAGVDEPAPAKVRRVTGAMLLRVGLFSFAAYALISAFAGVDFDQLWDDMAEASVALLVVGLLLGQTPRFAQAISTQGASPIRLLYGPVVALQFAIAFINLAIPSTAARVAVNIRFFQRQGVPGAQAVSIGAVDGFAGFVVQVLILLATLVLGVGGTDLDLSLDRSGDSGGLLLVVLGFAVLAVGTVLVVPKLRHKVVGTLSVWLRQAWSVVRTLRSPGRWARLLGGNFLSEVLFATTLGVFCLAYDAPVPLATLLVINVFTSLFAGLMPVPGGIGVTEGALITGLTAAGVDETTAFAIVISYRLAVFYLPPIWGAAAFRWLERNHYL